MIQRLTQTLIIALALFTAGAQALPPQMPPESGSIVRNDASSPITFEYQANGDWTKTTLEPSKDTRITAERIRVATQRPDDSAVITLDLQIQGGKKYRIFWNDQTSMWDIRGTS